MKYRQAFLFLVILLAVLSLSKIRFLEENLMAGDELEMFTNVANNGNEDAEDVRIVAYFPELGELYQQSRFGIEDYYNRGMFSWFNMPSTVPAGDYLVRVAVSNDDYNTHEYRYITVE